MKSMLGNSGDYPAAVKTRSWALRACAVLLLIYSAAWGYIAVSAFIAIQRAPTISPNPGAIGIFYAAIVIGATMCPWLLTAAVLVWRASPVGVVFAVLTSLCVALPLVLMLGTELLYIYTHPGLFDWKLTLGDVALLILGPGLVIGLLFVPDSYRAWARRPT
jgi:hypothetical protein